MISIYSLTHVLNMYQIQENIFLCRFAHVPNLINNYLLNNIMKDFLLCCHLIEFRHLEVIDHLLNTFIHVISLLGIASLMEGHSRLLLPPISHMMMLYMNLNMHHCRLMAMLIYPLSASPSGSSYPQNTTPCNYILHCLTHLLAIILYNLIIYSFS